MEHNIQNRMDEPRGRGRPKKPPSGVFESEPVVPVDIKQPDKRGILCPGCRVGMVPKRDGTQESKCYANCPRCGVRLLLTFNTQGYMFVRRV